MRWIALFLLVGVMTGSAAGKGPKWFMGTERVDIEVAGVPVGMIPDEVSLAVEKREQRPTPEEFLLLAGRYGMAGATYVKAMQARTVWFQAKVIPVSGDLDEFCDIPDWFGIRAYLRDGHAIDAREIITFQSGERIWPTPDIAQRFEDFHTPPSTGGCMVFLGFPSGEWNPSEIDSLGPVVRKEAEQ